ncbi:MAG: hypothetical protein QM757_26555 [Paludibaculum sp.]
MFDRASAYRDRMAGMSWAELEEKYKIAASTIRGGIIRYAKTNRLELPPPETLAAKRDSGANIIKPPGHWECPHCHVIHTKRDDMRECCPKSRSEAAKLNTNPEHMRSLSRLGVEARKAKGTQKPAE